MRNHKKLNKELPYDTAILILGRAEIWTEICTVLIGIIHNSKKVDITQVSINEWKNRLKKQGLAIQWSMTES